MIIRIVLLSIICWQLFPMQSVFAAESDYYLPGKSRKNIQLQLSEEIQDLLEQADRHLTQREKFYGKSVSAENYRAKRHFLIRGIKEDLRHILLLKDACAVLKMKKEHLRKLHKEMEDTYNNPKLHMELAGMQAMLTVLLQKYPLYVSNEKATTLRNIDNRLSQLRQASAPVKKIAALPNMETGYKLSMQKLNHRHAELKGMYLKITNGELI